MREPKDHPLVLEIEGVINAIKKCPDSPEKDEALLRANRAKEYAIKIVTDYEDRHHRIMNSFLETGNEARTLLHRLIGRRNRDTEKDD